jgi:hypothetical protein
MNFIRDHDLASSCFRRGSWRSALTTGVISNCSFVAAETRSLEAPHDFAKADGRQRATPDEPIPPVAKTDLAESIPCR